MGLANQVVESFNNAAGVALSRGMIVRATIGVRRTLLAQADSAGNLVSTLGIVNNDTGPTGRYFAVTSGEAEVLLETGLTPAAGQTVYVSASVAGRGTNIIPVLAVEVGTIVDVSQYSNTGRVAIVLGSIWVTSRDSATWSFSAPRYFAVDYDAGSDEALGYSDVDMASAGLVAFKTLTKLASVLPRLGAGRKAVIAVATRTGGATYLKSDGVTPDDLVLEGIFGYRKLLLRGTVTDTTAGSVKFANSAADKLMAGFIRASGTNAAGYNITVNTTHRQKTVQLAGGGAVALATDYTFRAHRIRFDSATTTAALRNVTRMLSLVSGAGDVFWFDEDLPASPVTGNSGDVFYIESPGVAVNEIQTNTCNLDPYLASSSELITNEIRQGATSVVGIKQTSNAQGACNLQGSGDTLEVAGCWSAALAASIAGQEMVAVTAFYSDETGVPVRVGCGFKADSIFTLGTSFSGGNVNYAVVKASAATKTLGTFLFGLIASYVKIFSVEEGCSFSQLVLFSCGQCGNADNPEAVYLGIASSATKKPPRVDGNDAFKAFSLAGSQATIRLIECINADTVAAIRLSEHGCHILIDGAFGSTGNNSVGIDMIDAHDSTVIINPATTTVTGGLGDVRMVGPLIRTYAQITSAGDFTDGSNNKIIASNTGNLSRKITGGTIGNYPVLDADPASPADGDVWITDITGTRSLCARIGGTTYRTVLT